MLMMTGQLLNVFKTPQGVNKEGKDFGGQHKIQILGAVTLQNGETQNKLVDLTCHDVSSFEKLLGQQIRFPVGVMPSGGNVVYYIPRGGQPMPDVGGSAVL
jgi:hypothetical protein